MSEDQTNPQADQQAQDVSQGDASQQSSIGQDIIKTLVNFVQIQGVVETVTSIPTGRPTKLEQQVKLYLDDLISPTVEKLYVYSNKADTWFGFLTGTHNHDGTNSDKISFDDLLDNPITADIEAALAGTSGSPSATNKYVTNDDVAAAATASKIVRRDGDGAVIVPSTPDADTEAASKAYVDGLSGIIVTLSASNENRARYQTEFNPGASPKYFKVYAPGKVRLKIRIKTTDPSYGTLNITEYYPNDSGTNHLLLTTQVMEQTYTYYDNIDINVRAGSHLKIWGADIMINDIQINYDITETTTYSAFL